MIAIAPIAIDHSQVINDRPTLLEYINLLAPKANFDGQYWRTN